jgi:sugar (pentulose or hexulose) kinase
MDNVLLVDFGATHIKSAIYSISGDTYYTFNKITAPQNISTVPGQFVISQEKLMKIFGDICQMYKKHNYEAIYLSSQMHGFIAVDGNNKPLTDYISWQDQRGIVAEIENFSSITGMKNRLGLPVHNFNHMVNVEKAVKGKVKLITLPEFLTNVDNKTENIVHNSMIAATGFYDINTEKVSDEILEFIGHDISFNENTAVIEVAGYYKDTPIYAGVGDLQAAIYAIDTGDGDSVIVNVGTGSQVSSVSDAKIRPAGIEYRPYIGEKHIHTITHIPAGRAINAFIRPFQDLGIDCWARMKDYPIEQVLNSNLEIDFAVFESATGYDGGGFIKGIKEDNYNIDNILASLINQLSLQYVRYIKKFNCNPDFKWVILSGGIPKSVPTIPALITAYTEKSCITSGSNIDETLHGLSKIARRHAN